MIYLLRSDKGKDEGEVCTVTFLVGGLINFNFSLSRNLDLALGPWIGMDNDEIESYYKIVIK
jgi:hypothetical protein